MAHHPFFSFLFPFLLFPSHCPSIQRVWLSECSGVRPMRMVALNSTTLLSMGILVYSARRFGYSPLTLLVKNQFSICQSRRMFSCLVSRGVHVGYIYKWLINADSEEDSDTFDLREILASLPDLDFLFTRKTKANVQEFQGRMLVKPISHRSLQETELESIGIA